MPLSSVVGAQSIVKPGVCTSTTRPASPYVGQCIYETDTLLAKVWTGSAWEDYPAGKANTASPTFTGTPTLPTGTIATTQTASNNSTAVATTAYVDAADALKANLASPTFTGTPTLPTGTIATTQTALDSSTKVATTAFVTTAGNLKANIASPTLTGTSIFSGGAVGGTAGNTVETHRSYVTQSNGEILKTNLTKTSTGADWTTSAWMMQRVVDTSPMGYIKLGNGIVALGDGTTDSLIVDNGGRVRMPSQPAFSAYNVNAASGGQDIVFATTTVNAGSCYNTSNGRFTAPVAGSYWFAYQALQQNGNTGEYRHALYKNGNGYGGLRFIIQKDVASWQSTYAYGVVYLAANDYVTVRYESGAGTMYTDGNYSNFSGYLIG